MTDQELTALLRRHQIEEASPHVLERSRERALIAFRNAPQESPHGKSAAWHFLRPAMLAGLVCLFAGIAFWTNRPAPSGNSSALMDEMEALFPGQVGAIILERDNISIVVSESPLPRPADQRVSVVSPEGREILTYSGNRIQIPGSSTVITPLISGMGKVIAIDDSGRLWIGKRIHG
jgi:hypothetical protein